MKKTISVNIKGMNFIIEEDAYEKLSQYLNRLETNLMGQNGYKDILEDIELRIAELCQQFITDKKQVIEISDINQIITTLGEPEEFLDEQEENNQSSTAYEKSSKHLYRDIDEAKIAGICAGLSNYFNIDVIIIRIIFLLFLFIGGFGFPLYIILWIVIPKADSTIDRLRMHGKPITVDSVKDEIESAASRMTSSSKSFADKIRKDESYSKRFSKISRIITSIFGFGLIAAGLTFLVVFFVFFFAGLGFIPIQNEGNLLNIQDLGDLILSDSNDVFISWIGITLTSLSIILFLISNGTFFLFKIKSKWAKVTSLSLFFFGIIGIVLCMYVGMKTSKEFISKANIEKEVAQIDIPLLTIQVDHPKNSYLGEYQIKRRNHFSSYDHPILIENNEIINHGIKLIYRPSKDSLFHVYQDLSSNGFSYQNAIFKSKNIKHKVYFDSTSLYVNSHYSYPKSDKIRNQDVQIIIEIPAHKSVKVGDQLINLDPQEEEIEKTGYLKYDGAYEEWY